MTNIVISFVIILSVILTIVFLVFKSDNAVVICKDLESLLENDCVIKIKIRKKRRGTDAERNN